MYDALARSVLEPMPERVAEEVRRARERHPKLSKSDLSAVIVRRACARSAAAAALSAAPSGWLHLLPIAADFPFQVLSMDRTALAVAQALRRPTSAAERALAAVASLAAAGVSVWAREKAVRSARSALRDRPPAFRAACHALIAGALSGAAVYAIGLAARDYCRKTSPPSRSG